MADATGTSRGGVKLFPEGRILLVGIVVPDSGGYGNAGRGVIEDRTVRSPRGGIAGFCRDESVLLKPWQGRTDATIDDAEGGMLFGGEGESRMECSADRYGREKREANERSAGVGEGCRGV